MKHLLLFYFFPVLIATHGHSQVACQQNASSIIIIRNEKHVLTYNKVADVPEGVEP